MGASQYVIHGTNEGSSPSQSLDRHQTSHAREQVIKRRFQGKKRPREHAMDVREAERDDRCRFKVILDGR